MKKKQTKAKELAEQLEHQKLQIGSLRTEIRSEAERIWKIGRDDYTPPMVKAMARGLFAELDLILRRYEP